VSSEGSGIAYALYVLARNRKAAATDLRYYSDSQIDAFAQPLARAQIGAALSLYGDPQRASREFPLGISRMPVRPPTLVGAQRLRLEPARWCGDAGAGGGITPNPGIVPELIGL
jgi:hypothetical protein